MASIDRTAYPRFGHTPTRRDLEAFYMPTPADVAFVTETARVAGPRLTLMVVLKCFQRLGYAPRLTDVPVVIAAHLRAHLRLPVDTPLGYDSPRTMYRHHQAVRADLGVVAYGPEARHCAIVAVHAAAQTMDHPADLINVAIEELIRQRFELPAFSTLDRLVGHVRTWSIAASSPGCRPAWTTISRRGSIVCSMQTPIQSAATLPSTGSKSRRAASR